MGQCVVDTSFLAKANGALAGIRAGNLLHRRINAISRIVEGKDRLRYNSKLLQEYAPHIKDCRNDIVEQLVALLDDSETIKVRKNTLKRQDKARANKCRWPNHDQHVLAAAIGGEEVTIHVTENDLGACGPAIKREFGFRVNHVA